MKFPSILIAVCSLGAISGEDAFNKMIDKSLVKLGNDLENKTKSLDLTLPDVSLPIKKNFLWMTLNGMVELREGVIKTMSGVKKVGDANLVATNGGEMIVTLSLSWTDLTLYFRDFHYKFLLLDVFDQLDLKIKDNLVFFNATFSYGQHDSCKMSMNQVVIHKLDDFSASIVPSHWYYFFSNYIAEQAIKDYKESILFDIDQNMKQFIASVLSNVDLCHYLPY